MRCDGMDVLDTHAVVSEAVERVREDRRPLLVEAVTYRFRGHSMADPEEYRTKEEVAQLARARPDPAFGDLLEREGILDGGRARGDRARGCRAGRAAVEFAESSPFPAPESLYEDVYVLGEQAQGRSPQDEPRARPG